MNKSRYQGIAPKLQKNMLTILKSVLKISTMLSYQEDVFRLDMLLDEHVEMSFRPFSHRLFVAREESKSAFLFDSDVYGKRVAEPIKKMTMANSHAISEPVAIFYPP